MHNGTSGVPDWILRGLPALNARCVLSRTQKAQLACAAALLAVALLLRPWPTLFTLNVLCIVLYLLCSNYRLMLQFLSLDAAGATRTPGNARGRDGGDWPEYTVLVPLYREGRVAARLLRHLAALDYPRDRLHVLLLVEEDDAETRAALDACTLPPFMERVTVPVSRPRTKPKACNYGLQRARGEYLVIYDAEDRPEPDQLKRAAAAFADAPPEVVCFQARLNFYNRATNALTRLFTAEYSAWFDFCLPALFLLDAPIPLGGTSNHLRLDALRALKGWDPFNVTEDCDLGIRLYAAGLRTRCLDSTTWEEATFRVAPWIRQRSRWIKGYIQTYFVHLRQHRRLLREMGAKRTAHFHLLFGATAFCLLLNPLYWALTLAWILTRAGWLTALYPLWVLIPAMLCLLAGNAAFVLSAMLACLNRGYHALVPWCLLMPAYWLLMSIGAWKGALQLLTRPFYWEKTPHGGAPAGGDAP